MLRPNRTRTGISKAKIWEKLSLPDCGYNKKYVHVQNETNLIVSTPLKKFAKTSAFERTPIGVHSKKKRNNS